VTCIGRIVSRKKYDTKEARSLMLYCALPQQTQRVLTASDFRLDSSNAMSLSLHEEAERPVGSIDESFVKGFRHFPNFFPLCTIVGHFVESWRVAFLYEQLAARSSKSQVE
jgi:hypothetical protein